MELEVASKRKKIGKMTTITGFLSFLIGLIALAGLNVSLLLDSDDFPRFYLIELPTFGLVLGFLGLLTRKRSRLYAFWGMGISLFILIFTFLMFGLAWSINPKP